MSVVAGKSSKKNTKGGEGTEEENRTLSGIPHCPVFKKRRDPSTGHGKAQPGLVLDGASVPKKATAQKKNQ